MYMYRLKEVADLLLHILFPKTCISCKREGSHLCEDCLATVPVNSEVFPLENNSSLSGLLSATSPKEPLIQTALRYYRKPPFLRDLSSQFAFLIISHFIHSDNEHILTGAVLVPVPLPEKQQRWIGFNPGELIAKELSSTLNLPLVSMEKVSNQTKRVLLVDDTYSTDSIMETAAFKLTEAGVKEIWGVVVARGTTS